MLFLATFCDHVAGAEGGKHEEAATERSGVTIALGITCKSMNRGCQVSVLNYSSVVIVVSEIVEEPVVAALRACTKA